MQIHKRPCDMVVIGGHSVLINVQLVCYNFAYYGETGEFDDPSHEIKGRIVKVKLQNESIMT